MLRSNRRIIIAGIAGLAALGSLIWAASFSYREFYQPAEYDYPAERYQPARDAHYPIPTKQHSPTEAYQPNCDQPQNKDDADLCAQWGAVRAVNETNRLTRVALKLGYIGFWVAFLGGLLGLVGTYFLVKTFQQNKRAADAANEANRPWLELKVSHGKLWAGDGIAVDVTLTVQNRGNSPATNVMPMVITALYGMNSPIPKHMGHQILLERFKKLSGAETTYGSGIFPQKDDTFELPTVFNQEDIDALPESPQPPLLFVIAGIRYRYAGVTHYTIDTFSLWLPKGSRDPRTTAMLLPSQFKLIRHQSSYIT